jgi:hypothetical protein
MWCFNRLRSKAKKNVNKIWWSGFLVVILPHQTTSKTNQNEQRNQHRFFLRGILPVCPNPN